MTQKKGLSRGTPLWLAVTGMMTAMNIVLSMSVFSVPVPGGHLYFCDAVINTAAILLDPMAAFIVGGVGSFLGDLLFYPAPMFVSLATHGLQALAVSLISHRARKKHPAVYSAAGTAVGAVIMVAGYTFGRAFVYATLETSLLKLPFECVQAVFGAAVALILCYPLRLKTLFAQMVQSAR